MVFSSLIFLYAFLPLSLAAYWLCRGTKAKNLSLLVSSLIFYAWAEPKYVLLLVFMALVSWACALGIEGAQSEASARGWLIASCVTDIGLIIYFKYAAMFAGLFGDVPEFIKNIALPLGISFYTFQLLTYVVDVYRGDARAQRSYLNVLLYAALFHQCVAGPIVRYSLIADELFSDDRRVFLTAGIRRFASGLAKKALLANPCGALADACMLSSSAIADPALLQANTAALSGITSLTAWMGIIAYTLQIYLDFSAYSDMAIGLGKMLGLHYPENFDYPYVSRSVKEFWRRWHMTLGSFFRDYVYIPLGGSRCSKGRAILNTFVVWALTGLWHGSEWNFVLWGLYYFVFLTLEKGPLGRLCEKTQVLSRVYLIAVTLFGWIIFRYTDLSLASVFVKSMFGLNGNAASDFISVTVMRNNLYLLIFSCICCTPVFVILENLFDNLAGASAAGKKVWMTVRDCVIPVVLLLLSTAALVGDSYNPFIYFRF